VNRSGLKDSDGVMFIGQIIEDGPIQWISHFQQKKKLLSFYWRP
jgi:hypothetical protein